MQMAHSTSCLALMSMSFKHIRTLEHEFKKVIPVKDQRIQQLEEQVKSGKQREEYLQAMSNSIFNALHDLSSNTPGLLSRTSKELELVTEVYSKDINECKTRSLEIITSIQLENKVLSDRLKDLEREHHQMQLKHEKQVLELQLRITELDAQAQQKEKASGNKMVEALKEQLVSMEEKHVAEIEKIRKEYEAKLEEATDRAEIEKAMMKAKLEKANASSLKFQQDLAQATNKCGEAERRIAAQAKQLTEQHREAISGMEAQITSLTQENTELHREISTLKSELRSLGESFQKAEVHRSPLKPRENTPLERSSNGKRRDCGESMEIPGNQLVRISKSIIVPQNVSDPDAEILMSGDLREDFSKGGFGIQTKGRKGRAADPRADGLETEGNDEDAENFTEMGNRSKVRREKGRGDRRIDIENLPINYNDFVKSTARMAKRSAREAPGMSGEPLTETSGNQFNIEREELVMTTNFLASGERDGARSQIKKLSSISKRYQDSIDQGDGSDGRGNASIMLGEGGTEGSFEVAPKRNSSMKPRRQPPTNSFATKKSVSSIGEQLKSIDSLMEPSLFSGAKGTGANRSSTSLPHGAAPMIANPELSEVLIEMNVEKKYLEGRLKDTEYKLKEMELKNESLKLEKERAKIDAEKIALELRSTKMATNTEGTSVRRDESDCALKNEIKFLIGKLLKAKGKLSQDTTNKSVVRDSSVIMRGAQQGPDSSVLVNSSGFYNFYNQQRNNGSFHLLSQLNESRDRSTDRTGREAMSQNTIKSKAAGSVATGHKRSGTPLLRSHEQQRLQEATKGRRGDSDQLNEDCFSTIYGSVQNSTMSLLQHMTRNVAPTSTSQSRSFYPKN
eukprot:TRINITY_DN3159_c0_g1_i4.p1 TRINITY_DN3159_c0_g1~~TRINITY_DN3159_c0_g1_i4.p1  ORF type:complete len:851 (+),score=229.93 TRINITY_DN3159_c0_g1_i4:157-2709(+)